MQDIKGINMSESNNEQPMRLFNPNWKEAEEHGRASRVGFSPDSKDENRCFCCFEHIEKNEIPLNQNTKQLQFLGFGFPLYYAFVRNCIILLLVTVCSYNLISIYESVYQTRMMCNQIQHQQDLHEQKIKNKGQSHHKQLFTLRHFNKESTIQQIKQIEDKIENENLGEGGEAVESQHQHEQKPLQCSSFVILIARTEKSVYIYQMLLRCGSFAIHLILLIYIRDKLIKLKQYFDQRTTSLSDYSLMLTNLPEIKNLRHEIRHKIDKEYDIKQSLVEIILIPNLEQYQKLQHRHNNLIQKIRNKVIHGEEDQEYRDMLREVELNQLDIEKFVVREKDSYINDQLQAPLAFLILNTQPDKDQLMDKFHQKRLSGSNWKYTKLKQAPQPKEIIWENIFLTSKQKASRTFFGWFLSILLLAALTVVFAIVSKHKSKMIQQRMHQFRHGKLHDNRLFMESLLLVFGMIFFVVLFNKLVISTLFHKFTDLERHSTTYKFQFSFCLKYCLGLFFTTALMTLLVQAIMIGNYYKQDYGVVEQQTIMFLVNSLFVPIFWAIHPTYLFNRYKKWRDYGRKHYTQHEANHIMQLPEYDVGKRYAQVLEIMWFTYLYITLIPVGGIISCIGLVFYYWVDKYNLLRRSSIHSSVSGDLIHLTLNLLDFTLVLRVLGEILFDYQTRDGIHVSSWVSLAIAVIYQVLPIQSIISIFNHQKFNTAKTAYNVARTQFRHTYYDEHVLFSMLKQDRKNLMLSIVNKLALKKTKQQIYEATRLA